jgi:hypothetical protein
MTQILVRFLVGGVVVSAFALVGDWLKPMSFAGLCGAAPAPPEDLPMRRSLEE